MDRYLGSWFDYCENHDLIGGLELDIPKAMWQLTSGLIFLNKNNVDIEISLSPEKILLCKKRREVMIKISGYYGHKNYLKQVRASSSNHLT